MNILITICARGGSKGIPRKNIIHIGGKPLIAYTIEKAKIIFPKNSIIALSSDDLEIIDVAKKWGVTTNYIRPKNLSGDLVGKIETIEALLLYEEKQKEVQFDYILDLDVTSPLRTQKDIESAFEILHNNPNAQNIFSVNPSHRNPYFNIVEQKKDGYFKLVKKPLEGILSRQSAPKTYDLNASFYWYRRSFFNANNKTAITEQSLIYEMDHLCFDLDHITDFEYLEYLAQNKKIEGLL